MLSRLRREGRRVVVMRCTRFRRGILLLRRDERRYIRRLLPGRMIEVLRGRWAAIQDN
jgi:hypothetical protein